MQRWEEFYRTDGITPYRCVTHYPEHARAVEYFVESEIEAGRAGMMSLRNTLAAIAYGYKCRGYANPTVPEGGSRAREQVKQTTREAASQGRVPEGRAPFTMQMLDNLARGLVRRHEFGLAAATVMTSYTTTCCFTSNSAFEIIIVVARKHGRLLRRSPRFAQKRGQPFQEYPEWLRCGRKPRTRAGSRFVLANLPHIRP